MFQSFFSVIVFIFGLIVGSFLNCLIYRLETEESLWKGRSFCPFCKHKLGLFDLIPVLSFFLLERKCRYCQKPISWQYPLVELATGFLFVLCFLFHVPYFAFVIVSLLVVVFVYDLKHYIIPDKIVYFAIAVAFIFNFQNLVSDYLILSAIAAAAFFLSIVLLSRGKWMGMGDVKLAFLMGLLLGWPGIFVALFLAFFIGAILGVILIISGKKQLSSEVPFGPFLVTGTFIALFWGPDLINWYQNLFLIK